MSIWWIEEARGAHIAPIAANMREADRREVWASGRYVPYGALHTSLTLSRKAWTCFVEGAPAFMWGVSGMSLVSRVGTPWLLGTDDICKVSRDFLRHSRPYVEEMQKLYPRLENYVHGDNKLSIRWLKWCGFTVEEEASPINDETFFKFWKERD